MANLRCPKCGSLVNLQQDVRMTGMLEITMGSDGKPVDAYQVFSESDCSEIPNLVSDGYLVCGTGCGWWIGTWHDVPGAVERAIAKGAILD